MPLSHKKKYFIRKKSNVNKNITFEFRKKKVKQCEGVGGEGHMDNFSSKPNFSPVWGENKTPQNDGLWRKQNTSKITCQSNNSTI